MMRTFLYVELVLKLQSEAAEVGVEDALSPFSSESLLCPSGV